MSSSILLSDNGVSSGSAGLKSSAGNDGVLVLQTANSSGTATNAVTIDTSQNVGIGTSSPSYKLDVVGSINASVAVHSNSDFIGGGASGSAALYANNTGGIVICRGSSSANDIEFYTNNAERARIDSSGNLLVGTTSSISSTYTPSVQIVGNFTPLVMRSSGATFGYWWRTGPDTSNSYVVANQSGAGVYVTNGSTSWSGYSDERLKENLVEITNASAKVSTLRAVTGNFISDESKTSRSFLIAQDVQNVLPEAVSIADQENGYLGLAYTDVIPLLVAAIKEQQALITQLQADVAALKA